MPNSSRKTNLLCDASNAASEFLRHKKEQQGVVLRVKLKGKYNVNYSQYEKAREWKF